MIEILFISGAGFIGSNLIKELLRGEYDIHVCEPKGANISRLEGLPINMHHLSLQDSKAISEVISSETWGQD